MTTLADSLGARAQTLGQTIISNLSPWYQAGVFYQSGPGVWYLSTLAPAALLATLSKYTTGTLRSSYIDIITEVIEGVLDRNVSSANLFTAGAGGAGNGPSNASNGLYLDTAAIEATANLAWILNQVESQNLPDGLWDRALEVCQANCDQLDIYTRDTIWYVNGNFNVHLLNAYWLTGAVSGARRPKYEDAYERALAFILNPAASDPKWASYGLITDVTGSAADWSDRQVHLAETNAPWVANPTNTFDPYYSMLQLDLLARLFVVNRDYRIAQIINGISNKLEPLINTTTWVVNCTTGSRKSLNQGYVSSWYAVIALLGCRALNTTLLDPTHILAMWDNSVVNSLSVNSGNGFMAPGTFRQLALTIAVVREAANIALENSLPAA